MFTEHPDKKLIGKENVLNQISTPALLLDLDLLEKNILTMANLARKYNMNLRPHAKGHKSPLIAGLQMEAGSIGISVATLGEAEEMVKGGLTHLLITSEITNAAKIERLITLNEKAEELLVVVDHEENIQALSDAANKKKKLKVLVDVDIGHGRAGVSSKEQACKLAKLIQSLKNLEFVGIQAYAGNTMHIKEYEERKKKIEKQNQKILEIIETLKEENISCPIITGGGTGSCLIDLQAGIYTDLQVGSYLFMDMEYEQVEIVKAGPCPFNLALFVLTSVISLKENSVIVDAGLKAFSTEGQPPRIKNDEKVSYTFMGDEHGKISWQDERKPFALGSMLTCIPPHIDPTINLYDFYHCFRKNVLVDLWPVQARGLH